MLPRVWNAPLVPTVLASLWKFHSANGTWLQTRHLRVGVLALRGPHAVIAHFTPPIHFHSSLCALLHGGRLIAIFISYCISSNSANMMNLWVILVNDPQLHHIKHSLVSSWVSALGLYLIFQHPSLYFLPFLSTFFIQDSTCGNDVWRCSSSYFRVATRLLIFPSFFFSPIMPSRGCPTDWSG